MKNKVSILERQQQRIVDSNYDPREFMNILTNKLNETGGSKILISSLSIILSIIFLFFFDKWMFGMIVIISTIAIASYFFLNFYQKQLVESLILFWINGVDNEKFRILISLLANGEKLNEFKYFIPLFVNAKSPGCVEFFPIFWEGMYIFDKVDAYYHEFSKKPFLIPDNYRISFQTSIVNSPRLHTSFVIGNNKSTNQKSSIVFYCIKADYYLRYSNDPQKIPTNINSDALYCSLLESIIGLVDSEKYHFSQLWDDKHLHARLRYVLAEVYTIITTHHEYTVENPTIYHLLLRYSKNTYLRYIAIDYALVNLSNFKLDLEQIPQVIEEVTTFCRRYKEVDINKKETWEKIPIYWLFLLGKRQRFENPNISRLYCRSCYIFATTPEIIGINGKQYHIKPEPKCVVCPQCRKTSNLEYVPGKIVGVISDRIFFSKEGNNIRIGLWDHLESKALQAVFEKLILLPGLNIDYDWALMAVLENLPPKNENGLPLKVEIPSDIALKENSLRILKDFTKEKLICVIRE